MEPIPIPKRITLRGLLAATFWAGATLAAWISIFRNPEPIEPYALQVAIVLFALSGPCITVAALCGRTLLGIAIGVGVTCAILFAIAMG